MHNPESALENVTHKIVGFWVRNGSSNLGQKTRHSDSEQKIKRNCRIVDFDVPPNHRAKPKKTEKREKILTLLENYKTMEHESDGDTNCNWRAWNSQHLSAHT